MNIKRKNLWVLIAGAGIWLALPGVALSDAPPPSDPAVNLPVHLPVNLELTTVPEQPAVLNPCQILLSAFRTDNGEAVTGTISVEIRPVSPKIRQMDPEWYRNVETFEPGRTRILHNFRIAGEYELAGYIRTPTGEDYKVSRRVQVVDNGAVGFWSETAVKSGLFVILTVGLFLLAGKFAARRKSSS